MGKKILVPDILPNNVKEIRTMKGISIQKVSKDLKIERNFISSVETCSNNFSGKNTIRAMKYYGINFYQMYDIKDQRLCPVTEWNEINKNLGITLININKSNFVLSEEISELIREKAFNILNKDYNEPIVNTFKIKECIENENDLLLNLDINFLTKDTHEVLFDINFAKNENIKLSDMLYYKKYSEEITVIREEIDNKYIKIVGDKLILDSEYKIPKSEKNLDDYYITSEFNINDPDITIKNDVKEDGTEVNTVSFKAIRPQINNIRTIRQILGIEQGEMSEELGYKYNGYINFELGHQKISSKMMWRLVKKFEIPLELIINIDEYYFKYCRRSRKD